MKREQKTWRLVRRNAEEHILAFLRDNQPATREEIIKAANYHFYQQTIHTQLNALELKGKVEYCPRSRLFSLKGANK